MTADNIIRAVETGPTDADRATKFREEVAAPLAELCKIMDRARSVGLKIDFQVGNNPYGQHVANVSVVKPL
jgi:hypothetical protein